MHSETVFVVFDCVCGVCSHQSNTTNTVRKKYRKVWGGGDYFLPRYPTYWLPTLTLARPPAEEPVTRLLQKKNMCVVLLCHETLITFRYHLK